METGDRYRMSVVPTVFSVRFTATYADARRMPSSRMMTEKLRAKPRIRENTSELTDKSVNNGETTETSSITLEAWATSEARRTVNVATPPTATVDCCEVIDAITSSWHDALNK